MTANTSSLDGDATTKNNLQSSVAGSLICECGMAYDRVSTRNGPMMVCNNDACDEKWEDEPEVEVTVTTVRKYLAQHVEVVHEIARMVHEKASDLPFSEDELNDKHILDDAREKVADAKRYVMYNEQEQREDLDAEGGEGPGAIPEWLPEDVQEVMQRHLKECPECESNNIRTIGKQTRAADEGQTVELTCEDCGHTDKFAS